MKLVFMGSDPIVLPVLQHLHRESPAGFELVSVYTQPDRRTGRGMHLQPNAIKQWAMDAGVDVRQPVKCGQEDAEYLRENGIDVVVAMAYGQILPKSFLEAPTMGTLNLHASLLPRLRGASPIHTAVALGHQETGLCLMRIIPKLDAGPVADCEKVSILAADKVTDVQAKLAQAAPVLMSRGLALLAGGELEFSEQEESEVTYCRIIEKTDCHLDFNQPALDLHNRVRAFQPWPGTSFSFEGTEIRILEAEVEESSIDANPGTVLPGAGGGLRIACASGTLKALSLQRPGGKPLPADAFLRGFPIAVGTCLESRPMRELEAREPFPYKKK
ncbi:MAG: methionyl-tRNA formyltransferase [Puniceicoccaceae bacterium]